MLLDLGRPSDIFSQIGHCGITGDIDIAVSVLGLRIACRWELLSLRVNDVSPMKEGVSRLVCLFASLSTISCHLRCCMAFSFSQTSKAWPCTNAWHFVPSLVTRRASLTLRTWRRSLWNDASAARDAILVMKKIMKFLYAVLVTSLGIMLPNAICNATRADNQSPDRRQGRSAIFQRTSSRVRLRI